jgi:hypothetical protein
VIAGPAPFGTADLDFFDGMDAEDREWYLRLTKPTAEAELDRECQETLDWVRNDLPRSGLPPGLLKMLQETAEDGLQAGAGGPLDQLVNIFVLFEPSIAHPSDPAAERHASAVQPPRELWGIS